MNRTDARSLLEDLMKRGLPHRAWDMARSLIEGNGDPTLRRVLKYGFLRTYLVHRLPTSFWDERRKEEARRLGVEPVLFRPRMGEVAFPVVFPSLETGCFVVAAVRRTDASQDELPPETEVDGEARRAIEAALDAARRLTGAQCRLRVSLDKPFQEGVRGASCGLAVALAALSCIEERELDDDIAATGEVTRELAINPVRDVAFKSVLRREARPLARLLCPKSDCDGDERVPVSRLEDARAAAWQPSLEAQQCALAELKRARATHPDHLHLSFRGLAKVARGAEPTTLEVLGFAVTPSLRDERKAQEESATELRHQLRNPDLTQEAHQEIVLKLQQLQRRHWGSRRGGGEEGGPLSFAEVLHRHTRFTVIGDPGAGKSLLTRLVFLACSPGEVGERARVLLRGHAGFRADAVEASDLLRTLLPVRLTLAEFGRTLVKEAALTLEEFIRRELRLEGARHALFDGLGALLDAGHLFVLCDGLDEVTEESRAGVVDRVLQFASAYPRVRMLVTSRPHGYYPKVEGFHHTQLAPLEPWQRRLLVARLHRLVETRRHPGPEGIARARHRTNALLLAIEKRDEWEQLSGNPLLLTISALTRTSVEGVPEHQVIVFEGLIQTILGEWRSALKRPRAEADMLLDVWSEVASELVQQGQRDGVGQARLLRMLSARLGAGRTPSPIDAKTALHLALEAGLLREDVKAVSFWHSTFAEFLAARSLAGDGGGAVERLLKAHVTPLTLHFAAALLEHVLDAGDECNALARELLERDGDGVQALLRPGLRTVTSWLVDGVRFNASIRERIWETWTEVLEKSAPSMLWGEFGRFAERVSLTPLAPRLAARLARLDTRRAEEIREGVARVVASAAHIEPAVRTACEQWLKEPPHSALRLYGAFGLASASVQAWSDELLDALGQFRATRTLSLHTVRALVRGSGAATLARLRELVGENLPSGEGGDKPQERSSSSEARLESERRERRLSAASLLAVAGYWDEDVARGVRLLLESHSGSFHDEGLQSLVRFCASESAVREALLEWIHDGSTLGERARRIVREVAPLYEDMPQKLLECMARASGKEREQLESMLVTMGEELYSLPELLRRCLEQEEQAGQWLAAARILRQLAPEDGCLHSALRRGMSGQDAAARARWANLALGMEHGSSQSAVETLLACSRSPDAAVRMWVYDGHPSKLMWNLRTNRLEGWLECAADSQVAAAARLDALNAVEQVESLREQVVPILRELLHVEDINVRREAARKLLRRDASDEHVITILVEEAVRSKGNQRPSLWQLGRAGPLAGVTVRALLRELSGVVPSGAAKDSDQEEDNWSFLLSTLAEQDPSCAEELLRALELPGRVGDAAWAALTTLIKQHPDARDTYRARLRGALTEVSPLGQFRLVWLGLWGEEKFPEAIALARALDPGRQTQRQLEILASLLQSADSLPDAARLWRLVLAGEDLDDVLDAAVALVSWFPQEVAGWIRPTVERLAGSPEPVHRLEAARFALRYGLMEEEARTTLLDCLGLDERAVTQRNSRNWLWSFSDSPWRTSSPANGALLDKLLLWSPRIDFESMHAVCGQWPELGLQQLANWLRDDDFERFDRAVKILSEMDCCRDQVCEALGSRLRSGPAGQLQNAIHLVEQHGFYSENMVEAVLTRYASGGAAGRDVESSLGYWLRIRPELWAVFRRQAPERRDLLAQWLWHHQRIVPDTVVFAVEAALSYAGTPRGRSAEYQLQRWCEPPRGRDAGQVPPEKRSPLWSTKKVRRWIREALVSQDPSADLFTILAFDRLAALGKVRTGLRIERLHRALSSDIGADGAGEDTLLYCQAVAARQLLVLGERDERIPRVLKATVHMLAETLDPEALHFASVLRTLQPADEALRKSLLPTVAGAYLLSFEQLPDLFDWMGLTLEERIQVLTARLDIERGRNDALRIFRALEEIGCPPERRATLILEFVSRHEGYLSVSMRLKLAVRPELAVTEQAKLLLGTIMEARSLDLKAALKDWIDRFASKVVLDDQDGRLSYRDTNYLSLRQHMLTRISKVDDPALVESVLAELVTDRIDDLLTLYRRARTDQSLSHWEWNELLALLSLEARDKGATRLAKEWLTLELWRTYEPEAVAAWLRS